MDERALWILDQKINDRGLLVDLELIDGAMKIDTEMRATLLDRMVALTGMDNPNSRDQLMRWLETAGVEAVDVTKKTVEGLLKGKPSDEVAEVLRLRQQLAKSSIAKYDAARRAASPDGRLRGLFQFAGAGRTGRWAGRIFQPQNLPRPPKWMEDWTDVEYAAARDIIASGDMELAEMIFGNVPELLSAMLRCIIRAPADMHLLIADFSAIEARVLAWLSGEEWRLEVFRTHGKIYEASASQMFKVPLEKIKKGNPEYELRQKGKVAELALGYQGGPNALKTMGALEMGVKENELLRIVELWREANQAIVAYWYAVEAAAIKTVQFGGDTTVGRISFRLAKSGKDKWLEVVLPSGRPMRYYMPWIEGGKLWFWGVNGYTKKWEKLSTYGGKLVENATQAVARDCLAEAMLKLDAAGYTIVGHVHDEVICEMPYGKGSVEDMEKIMGEGEPWADGLPLGAAGYATPMYRKE